MIKAIIFDNGGVLVDDSWPTYVRESSENLGITEEEFRAKVRHLVRPALVGELDYKDFLEKLVDIVGTDYGVLKMAATKEIRPGVEEWLDDLNNRGFILAILSNDFGDFLMSNKEHWNYERFCEGLIFNSSAMGVSKPSSEAFQHVLERLEVEPTEVVFIDDKEKNTTAASALGMNVIQFESLEQAKKELESIVGAENV